MRVVRHISTGRIVYRQQPDFEWGKGIVSAVVSSGYPEEELEEVGVTQEQWDAECALQEEERPRRMDELIDTSYPNPQKESYKLSQLYGLTQAQLGNYVDNNVNNLIEAKAFLKKLSAVVLWLVKQTKLDE